MLRMVGILRTISDDSGNEAMSGCSSMRTESGASSAAGQVDSATAGNKAFISLHYVPIFELCSSSQELDYFLAHYLH